MTRSEAKRIDFKRLRQLYASNPAARHVLDHFASRERNWRSTTVDRIHTNVLAEGADVSRADIIAVFRELEAAGCGSFKAGRKGWVSRFEWAVSFVSVGRAAAGETEQIEQIPEDERTEEDGAALVRHQFRLRADASVSFDLPANLSSAEASRLADFIKTLPITS
jgi:hypothetical protein